MTQSSSAISAARAVCVPFVGATPLDWLRRQHMALLETLQGHTLLMVHAGVMPSWTAQQTLALAGEVEQVLRGPDLAQFLAVMYGDKPARWRDDLSGNKRLRCIVNVLTRMRFCSPDGEMDFDTKEGAGAAPSGFLPLVDSGLAGPARCVVARHRLRLGWVAECGPRACGRRRLGVSFL